MFSSVFEHGRVVSSMQRNVRVRDTVECFKVFLSAGNNPIRNKYKTEFQHRLRKRDIRSGSEWFEKFQNRLQKLRVKTAGEIQSPNFTFSEVKEVVSKLKTGKSTDSTGTI